MSVVKVRKSHDYASINNAALSDERLTWGARGILAYLLSKPDHWEIRIAHLVKQSPQGKDFVMGRMVELEACGYLEVGEKYRDPESKQFTRDLTLFEVPADQPRSNVYSQSEDSQEENPPGVHADNPPGSESSQADNPTGPTRENRLEPGGKSACSKTDSKTDSNTEYIYTRDEEEFTPGLAMELLIEKGCVAHRTKSREYAARLIREVLAMGATREDFLLAITKARECLGDGEKFSMAYLDPIIRGQIRDRSPIHQAVRKLANDKPKRKSARELAEESFRRDRLQRERDITPEVERVE